MSYSVSINDLARQIHELNKSKGWWPEGAQRRDIPEKIALIHSEASEALEEYRDLPEWAHLGDVRTAVKDGVADKKPLGFGTELADIIIRTLDLAHAYGVDIDKMIRIKFQYNQTRPHRHGGKAC